MRRGPVRHGSPAAELRCAGAVRVPGRLLRQRGARRLRRAPPAAAGPARAGRAAARRRAVRAAVDVRDRDDSEDGLRGVLPHRLGLHPLRPRAGNPGRAGPRIGGRQPRRLLHADHGRRPAGAGPDLRALSQPGTRVSPRHRHRLLRAAARRGDRVRDAQVRARERGPDHHVRHDEGAGRRTRRRADARPVLRRSRPGGEADPPDPRHDARQGARGEPGARGDAANHAAGEGAARRRTAARRGHPARLGTCRGGGDRAGPDHRVRPALQEGRHRNHAVGHERGRAHRPPQDGFSRPQHADAVARRGGSHPALDRRDDQAGCDSARRREGLPAVRQRADARHLPVRELRHARDAAQGQAAAVRGPDRPERALPAGPAGRRRHRHLHRPQGRQGGYRVRHAEARADSARHLRRDRLPGAGHAHRQRPGRLHDGRGRRAAQGDGQEDRVGDGGAAREVPDRCGRAGARRGGRQEDLGPDGVLRRLRVQQEPFGGVRAPRLPDRLPESELPGVLHGRAVDDRAPEYRQGRPLPG